MLRYRTCVIASDCTVPYSLLMRKMRVRGAEAARNQLPQLLDAAEKGASTLITRRGRPVAELIPAGHRSSSGSQQPLNSLVGSGKGLWSPGMVQMLRDEWTR